MQPKTEMDSEAYLVCKTCQERFRSYGMAARHAWEYVRPDGEPQAPHTEFPFSSGRYVFRYWPRFGFATIEAVDGNEAGTKA